MVTCLILCFLGPIVVCQFSWSRFSDSHSHLLLLLPFQISLLNFSNVASNWCHKGTRSDCSRSKWTSIPQTFPINALCMPKSVLGNTFGLSWNRRIWFSSYLLPNSPTISYLPKFSGSWVIIGNIYIYIYSARGHIIFEFRKIFFSIEFNELVPSQLGGKCSQSHL